MKRALVPGTFDPITSGHIDIITRSTHIADEIIVAVAPSVKKNPLFTLEERVELARAATAHLPTVTVVPLEGLLVEFARKMGASAVVKGLRAITDFEYEFQQTALNYEIDPKLETIFIMSPPHYMYLSSSIVREIASMNGPLDNFVPDCVQKALREKFGAEDFDLKQ